ncbi:MAG: phospholipid carrier-dependent glycosyltransferase [Oscillatoriales cyanobacterium]|nr:MAG: phospholipid carrier-dependent glycosyltransferase [Oscillatoriales cyanobacterium]
MAPWIDRALAALKPWAKATIARSRPQPDWVWLVGLWLVGTGIDRLWFALDQSAPAWDQAEYLTAALTYGQALETAQWWSGDWWRSFWELSPKVPPLVAIATVPFLWIFGPTADAATLLNSACAALLLGSVYAIGRRLFDRPTGLWAATLCWLMPGLWRVRLDYLTDFPLVAVVAATLALLILWATGWRWPGWSARRSSWVGAVGLGIGLGAGLLVKQPFIFFTLPPLLAVLGWAFWRSHWQRVAQGITSILIAIGIAAPWYRTNWLFILSGGKRATIDSAIAEGDPSLGSIDAWIYYLKLFPPHLSWPILGMALAGGILWFLRYQSQLAWGNLPVDRPRDRPRGWGWLLLLWVSAYLCCSLLINKDWRYVLPYWPIGAIALARGWLVWRSRGRWTALGITAAVMLLGWFGPAGALTAIVPGQARSIQTGPSLPHRAVVQTVIDRAPWLNSTIGVLPSTAALNQHNLNFFGAARDFQVYGRQVGANPQAVARDGRSLDWYLLKTGDQGSMRGRGRRQAQAATVETLRSSPDLQPVAQWPLPDGSEWQLLGRRLPAVSVSLDNRPNLPLQLTAQLPESAPPGQPLPVNYRWQGPAAQLQDHVALLTWQREPTPNRPPGRTSWIDDRAIGQGRLRLPSNRPEQGVRVLDRSVMLPPPDLAPGRYRLWASLASAQPPDRRSPPPRPIPIPTETTITIDPAAPVQPAPELAGVTQLRLLGLAIRSGRSGLEQVFNTIGQINQYDPTQAYVNQAIATLELRLAQQPDRLGWRYGLGLAQVLARDIPGAIASFQTVAQQDPQNPWAHGYLALVNLYDWRTNPAQRAIDQALALAPRQAEFHYLQAIAYLQRWQLGRAIAEYRIGQALEPPPAQG